MRCPAGLFEPPFGRKSRGVGENDQKNYFNSLTALTDAQAEELSQHKGALWLDGLTTLSNPQAEALAKHDGILFLNGLTTLSESAATALRASPKRILPDKFKD